MSHYFIPHKSRTIMTPLGGSTQVSEQNNGTTEVSVPKQNGTANVSSKKLEGKVYKLVIQIDKIRPKPGPKCKKPALLAASKREKISRIREIIDRHSGEGPQDDVEVVDITLDGEDEKVQPSGENVDNNLNGDNVEIRLDSNVTIKLDVGKTSEVNQNQANIRIDLDQPNQCPVCQEHMESLLALFSHHEMKHVVCQLCDVPFASQVACDKHETLHQGNDELLVYKCHLCERSYDCTRNLKVHVKGSHWELLDAGWKADSEEVKGVVERLLYECGICGVSLKDEANYRNHIVLHQTNNPILRAPEKISDMHPSDQENLKLTCTVCSQTFNNPRAAEAHICCLRKTEEFYKACSICKKVFDNLDKLNQHLAGHLSRAHHCTICRKLFVNRVTLANHMRTHVSHN